MPKSPYMLFHVQSSKFSGKILSSTDIGSNLKLSLVGRYLQNIYVFQIFSFQISYLECFTNDKIVS